MVANSERSDRYPRVETEWSGRPIIPGIGSAMRILRGVVLATLARKEIVSDVSLVASRMATIWTFPGQ